MMNIYSQPHIKPLQLALMRGFSAAAAAVPQEPPQAAKPERTSTSNVFKGQHVRYIPKKRLRFDFASPEGPLALIY